MSGCCCQSDDPEESRPIQNPLKNRGCTDIIPLIIFLAFWIGMLFIAGFSIINGDAARLIYGYDSYGNTCGMKNRALTHITGNKSGMDMTDRSFVFFSDIKHIGTSLELCIKKCPDKKMNSGIDLKQFANDTGSKICDYDVSVDDYPTAKTGVQGPCPVLPLSATTDILHRCIPSSVADFGPDVFKKIAGFLNKYFFLEQILADLYISWKLMILLCLISLAFTILVVLLIRFVATVVVWLIVIIVAVASIAGTAFLWWTYNDYRKDMQKTATIIPLLKIEIASETSFLVYSIIATVLTVILLLVLLVMRKRIALAVALFGEAGKCIMAMPTLLVQPVWTFLILITFWFYWVAVIIFLSTAGSPTHDDSFGGNMTGRVKFVESSVIRYMWWYHIVGLIWISEFILACQQMVISGGVATWYFTRNKDELGCAVGKSVCRIITYHMGTAAFGSFIITLVKIPRYFIMYTQKKLKGTESEIAKFVAKCCICCLWCLEKCLKFLNQNAYTIVAIEGTNFCTSARKALLTLASNILRVAAINGVGGFVLFLAKIMVMSATAAIGVLLFKDNKDLNFFLLPILIVCIFAYFIAHCFLSVYEMVIDAMLLCFCEDTKMNDGTPGKEYYMNSSLMEFVKNSSTALNKIDGTKPDAKNTGDDVDGADDDGESVPMAADNGSKI